MIWLTHIHITQYLLKFYQMYLFLNMFEAQTIPNVTKLYLRMTIITNISSVV